MFKLDLVKFIQVKSILSQLAVYIMKSQTSQRVNSFKEGGLIYARPPTVDPKRYQIVKFATWRMRIYQEFQSIGHEELQAKSKANLTIDKIFPKLFLSLDDKQFYTDFLMEYSNTHQEDLVSHFICRMLYCRDLRNHDTFIRMEKIILELRLNRIAKGIAKMNILKQLVSSLSPLSIEQLNINEQQYKSHELKITKWYDRQGNNQACFMKVPFQLCEAGLRRRKCFIHKGFVYADIQTAQDIVLNLYSQYLKQMLMKIRGSTQKLLQNDVQNQLKPFMDKAINAINNSTIQQSQLSSQFKLNMKNIDGVAKRFFPPCMLHLNKKLKENNHLKHDGRRQLWLFFKGCGMDVHDNKEYFRRYLSIKVSNSDLKGHMYNIQHAYGLVGKKQPQRPKMCRAIITGADPKKDEHHGCPFKHWSKESLADFLNANYSLKENQFKEIMDAKNDNYFQVACGRLFEANFKPENQRLPEQITSELGKSPHQYFIAGMVATQWISTKTLRPTNKKPVENIKMELQF